MVGQPPDTPQMVESLIIAHEKHNLGSFHTTTTSLVIGTFELRCPLSMPGAINNIHLERTVDIHNDF